MSDARNIITAALIDAIIGLSKLFRAFATLAVLVAKQEPQGKAVEIDVQTEEIPK